MNKFLELYSLVRTSARQTGKTFRIEKWAKKCDGVVICATVQQQQAFNAKNIRAICDSQAYILRGSNAPIDFDHFTVECLLKEAGDVIESRDMQIEKLEDTNNALIKELIEIRKAIKYLKKFAEE